MIAVLTAIAVSFKTSDREWLQINCEAAMATFYASPDPMGPGDKRAKGIRTGLVFIK